MLCDIPTSLYIHIPWCIRKCPYCDFNSHKSPEQLPEKNYIDALIADLIQDVEHYGARSIHSIFIGGGTPSLFSAEAYAALFKRLKAILPWENIEITLEANPGTIDQQRFMDYRAVGINRLSLGIQSFNSTHLKKLGRIHDDRQAHLAIECARKAGFEQINLDIMHGLPQQTIAQGLEDLKHALSYQPEHLSWYQLTLEPNTIFYKSPPPLPSEDNVAALEEQGFDLLIKYDYQRYEISAFSHHDQLSQHNLNYWLFGDYFAIGAGAHGKLTQDGQVVRMRKHRQPSDYLNPTKPFKTHTEVLNEQDLVFEFMLNTTRLEQTHSFNLFSERTGLPIERLLPMLNMAKEASLINIKDNTWQVTPLGRRYTNDLQALFLV